MRQELDELDIRLLELIQEDDRRSYADLGQEVGLSISGVNARLRKLIASGVIRRFGAQVDPNVVGLGLCAFVEVMLDRPEHDRGFLEAVGAMPAILECHHVTGEFSYLLKVRVATTAALERLISNEIKRLPGVTRSHTVIALSSSKETTVLDLRGTG